jgi:hypothetical protein
MKELAVTKALDSAARAHETALEIVGRESVIAVLADCTKDTGALVRVMAVLKGSCEEAYLRGSTEALAEVLKAAQDAGLSP